MSPLAVALVVVWGTIGLGGLIGAVVALRRPITDADREYSAIDQDLDARARARRDAGERAARSALGYTGPRQRVDAAPRDCPVKPGPFGGA